MHCFFIFAPDYYKCQIIPPIHRDLGSNVLIMIPAGDVRQSSQHCVSYEKQMVTSIIGKTTNDEDSKTYLKGWDPREDSNRNTNIEEKGERKMKETLDNFIKTITVD